MNNWAPLWSGLVDSSIWEEPDHVFRVFMAMLSLKDVNSVVSMDGYRLAKRIHMDFELVTDALKVLASPDTKRPGQQHDGRRIKKVDDGWEILNGEYYRKLVQDEMRRVRNRKAQAAWRDRKKVKSKPSPGENQYVKTLENEGQEAADAQMDAQANGIGPELVPALVRADDREHDKAVKKMAQQMEDDLANMTPGKIEELKYLRGLKAQGKGG